MKCLIKIGYCKVCNGYFDEVSSKKFEVSFNNFKAAHQWALQQAKELYPEMKYGAWNGVDNFSDTHYCHAILEQDNSIFQSEIIIDFCY